MATSSYRIEPGSDESRKSRRRLAEALIAQGTDTSPVQHWTQGMARIAQALTGGMQMRKMAREEKGWSDKILAEITGQQPTGEQPAAATAPSGVGRLARILAGTTSTRSAPMNLASAVEQAGSGGNPNAVSIDPNRMLPPNPGAYLPDENTPPGMPRVGGSGGPAANYWKSGDAESSGYGHEGGPFPHSNETRVAQAGAMPPELQEQIGRLWHAGPQGQALALQIFERHTTPKEQPTEVQEFEYGQQNPAFAQRQIELKAASRPQVTVDQRQENEFSKQAGQLQAKRFADLAEDGFAARQMISDVEMLRTLGAQIGTGKGAQVMAAIGPYAQALGVNVEGLDEAQAYEAIVNRVAPNLRVKGSGAQSDFELRNFLKSIPSLGNTPGGNEIASRVLQGLFQNKVRAADIGAKALNGEITRTQAEEALRGLPDPMGDYREFIKRTKPEAAKQMQDLRQKYGLE